MKWFDGIIAEAVTLSRKNGSVFVVYVEGDDEKSVNFTQFIDNANVSQLLESQHFVAIKIKANSTSYFQFAELYKQVPVPSIYFIGKTGTPLEIITDVKDAKELQEKISVVLEKHGVKEVVLNQPGDDTTKASMSSNFINAEASSSSSAIPIITEKTEEPKKEETKTEETEPSKSLEDKVEHAKQLIEIKKQNKKVEEDEKEKMQEIERRKTGQSVQNFKKWQKEQEFKQLMEQREKEKKQQQADRQRVLAQIEQDKADRAAKFQTNPPSTTNAGSSKLPATTTNKSNVANLNSARLQLKLPDGSSWTKNFEVNSTLQDVRNFITEDLMEFWDFKNFTLSTTFPRRVFTENDFNCTLTELELVPNAVLLILPLSNAGAISTNPTNLITMIFWSVITPFATLFEYIKGLIYGKNNRRDVETQSSTSSTPASGPSSSNAGTSTSNYQNSKRPMESNKGDENKSFKKKAGDSTTVIKRQGNIHRLSDRTDSEDENNTWNGNSTQQM